MKRFRMSENDYQALRRVSQPVPYLIIGSREPISLQERANELWKRLGTKMGFDYTTVRPCGADEREFMAEEDK